MSAKKESQSPVVDVNSPRYDPFRHPESRSWKHPVEFAKIAFVVVVIIPVRIFFALFWFFVYYSFLFIGTLFTKSYEDPPTKWQRYWVNGVLHSLSPLRYAWSEYFSFHMAFPFVQTFGDKSMVDKATGERANLIVSNHVSYMDILLLMTNSDDVPGFVSKVEVKKIPIIGWYSQCWQCLYVDRTVEGGVTSLIQKRASDYRYPPVVIFPEGTTTNGKFLIPFKTGAFVAGKPVKPVAIRYKYKTFSPSWESVKAVPHLLQLLTQVYNAAEIYYLPVYVPNEDEKADPALYASNVRHAISEVLGAELHDATFNDKRDYLTALRGKFDAN